MGFVRSADVGDTYGIWREDTPSDVQMLKRDEMDTIGGVLV